MFVGYFFEDYQRYCIKELTKVISHNNELFVRPIVRLMGYFICDSFHILNFQTENKLPSTFTKKNNRNINFLTTIYPGFCLPKNCVATSVFHKITCSNDILFSSHYYQIIFTTNMNIRRQRPLATE